MTKNSENKNAINKIKFSEQSVITEKKVNYVSKKIKIVFLWHFLRRRQGF